MLSRTDYRYCGPVPFETTAKRGAGYTGGLDETFVELKLRVASKRVDNSYIIPKLVLLVLKLQRTSSVQLQFVCCPVHWQWC